MKVFIFCRYPEMGKVKTRIAAESGNAAALAIYQKMLKAVFENIEDSGFSYEVHHTGGSRDEVEFWLEKMDSRPQAEGDLGDKLSYAVENWFETENESLVIIGSDQIEIDNAVLVEAENILKDKDLVLGPAEDGGYYLIGMNQPHKEIFEAISWGSDTVFNETVVKINDNGLTYGLLPVKSDIDYLQDVPIEWQRELLLHENDDN